MRHGWKSEIQQPGPAIGAEFFEYAPRRCVELYNEPITIMKTKLMLILTAAITLTTLSSCYAPYGGGYGYNNYYRPSMYGGFGSYGLFNNYYSRPGYAYSGYRSPYYGRPGFTGYRPSYSSYRPSYSGYRGGYSHVGGFGHHGGSYGGYHHHR